jgi:hypothetical protein
LALIPPSALQLLLLLLGVFQEVEQVLLISAAAPVWLWHPFVLP